MFLNEGCFAATTMFRNEKGSYNNEDCMWHWLRLIISVSFNNFIFPHPLLMFWSSVEESDVMLIVISLFLPLNKGDVGYIAN